MEVSEDINTKKFPVPIEHTGSFIEGHIHEVTSVKKLASLMGYSRSYLSTRVKNEFDITVSELLRSIRYKKIKKFIAEHPYETSRAIASRSGLRDDKALYKFLSRHYDTNFTEMRDQVLRTDVD